MRLTTSAQAATGPRRATTRHGWGFGLAVLLAFAVTALLPARAAADGSPEQPVAHSLGVSLSFPDDGLTNGEQLCLALYPGDVTDLAVPPLQSRCLDPGGNGVVFVGLGHGHYQIVVPSVGSILEAHRYQGQLVATNLPDEPEQNAFGIDVTLALTPEVAGTTGRVQVNVYGCPPGTNGGGDATVWQSECTAVAAGIPLTLSGVGSIEDTSIEAVTAQNGETTGRVEFTNLPAGSYQLDGQLPENVTANPALFIESSIDGSIGPIDPESPLAVRPAEVVAVDVFLILETEAPGPVEAAPPPADLGGDEEGDTSANPSIAGSSPAAGPAPPTGAADSPVTGGLTADEIADREAAAAAEADS